MEKNNEMQGLKMWFRAKSVGATGRKSQKAPWPTATLASLESQRCHCSHGHLGPQKATFRGHISSC